MNYFSQYHTWLDINAEPRNHKLTFHTQRKSLLKPFLLFIVIIPCTIYAFLFLLFLLLSSGYPDVEPPVGRLRLERWPLRHTVYTSPPKINVMPTSSFSTFKLPARGVLTGHYRLAWERATSGYLDISLQENSRDIFLVIAIVIANILKCNSFSARTLFRFYKDFFQFWPKTVYFNKFLNLKYNKILLYYWLSLAPDSASIIRVVKQNRTTAYQFCYQRAAFW